MFDKDDFLALFKRHWPLLCLSVLSWNYTTHQAALRCARWFHSPPAHLQLGLLSGTSCVSTWRGLVSDSFPTFSREDGHCLCFVCHRERLQVFTWLWSVAVIVLAQGHRGSSLEDLHKTKRAPLIFFVRWVRCIPAIITTITPLLCDFSIHRPKTFIYCSRQSWKQDGARHTYN